MSIEHELEAAQSVLDNANYSLANALALDQPPEETPETNFLEQQLLQAQELERSAERAAALEPTTGDFGACDVAHEPDFGQDYVKQDEYPYMSCF